MAEVASALHCAWVTPSPDTGKPLCLVHRDVKPENIRLSKHGEVKLLDFGIARTSQMGREALTATGQMPFTPGYAPPEMFTEKPPIGDFTDIYALGATTYRLLVGERFFEGVKLKRQVNLAADREGYEAFLRERLEKIRGNALRQLLWGCLAYRREDRPSAEALAKKLTSLSDAMEGPTCSRWARSVPFPEPSSVEGGSLTGRTIEGDDGQTVRIRRLVTREDQIKAKSPATVLLQIPSTRDLTEAPGPRSRWWVVAGLVLVMVLVVGPLLLAFGATVIGAGLYAVAP
jgi:serine/threonine protein kinase